MLLAKWIQLDREGPSRRIHCQLPDSKLDSRYIWPWPLGVVSSRRGVCKGSQRCAGSSSQTQSHLFIIRASSIVGTRTRLLRAGTGPAVEHTAPGVQERVFKNARIFDWQSTTCIVGTPRRGSETRTFQDSKRGELIESCRNKNREEEEMLTAAAATAATKEALRMLVVYMCPGTDGASGRGVRLRPTCAASFQVLD